MLKCDMHNIILKNQRIIKLETGFFTPFKFLITGSMRRKRKVFVDAPAMMLAEPSVQ